MIKDPGTGWVEATIVINGQTLNFAESMSVRVAVSGFLMQLADREYADDLGSVADGYRRHLESVQDKMFSAEPQAVKPVKDRKCQRCGTMLYPGQDCPQCSAPTRT